LKLNSKDGSSLFAPFLSFLLVLFLTLCGTFCSSAFTEFEELLRAPGFSHEHMLLIVDEALQYPQLAPIATKALQSLLESSTLMQLDKISVLIALIRLSASALPFTSTSEHDIFEKDKEVEKEIDKENKKEEQPSMQIEGPAAELTESKQSKEIKMYF